jgi:hypothetical protein
VRSELIVGMDTIGLRQLLHEIIMASWIGMFAFWFVSRLRLKQTIRSQSEAASRIAVSIVAAAWWLLFGRGFGKQPLASQWAAPTVSVSWFVGSGLLGLEVRAPQKVYEAWV